MTKPEQVKEYLDKHSFRAFAPKAVLFDMDGVLYDSMPNHVVAWRESMAQFGIVMTEHEAYATEGARGVDTIINMVRLQQGREISMEEAQKMYDVKSRLFHEMPEPPIMPGVPELLEQLKATNISMNVVTGSGQRPLIQRLLRDFGEYLDESHITTAYDVKRGKPYPDPYLMGLKKAGQNLHRWEAVVVENAPLGVMAGVAAKIYTIGVNTGPLPKTVLKNAGANIVFKSMEDLAKRWDTFYSQSQVKSHDERWLEMYERIMNFMDKNKKCPSKHKPSDMKMVNWMKHNRKMRNRGELTGERLELFKRLVEKSQFYRRINQYAYYGLEKNEITDHWIKFDI